MDVTKLVELIKTHWIVFIAAAIIVTPIVFKIISIHYQERMEALKAKNDLLTEQKQFLLDRLKQIKVISSDNTIPQHTDNTSSTKSVSKGEFILFPKIENEDDMTKKEVEDLARFYGLFNRWSVNPHLRFKTGDVSYWHEQGFSKEDLIREFESRSTVLRRAEKSREKIPSQGDLSHKAEQLQALGS